jgi:hypothetical protein
MMLTATTQAAVPTARAMAWTPVAVTATGLLLAAVMVRVSGREAPLALSLSVGAIAALTVLSLRDSAAALMAAVPVSAWRRRVLRLGWLAVAVVPLWLVVTTVLPEPGPATGLASLLGLTTSALAVAVWLPDDDLGRAAALPLVWVGAGSLLGGFGGVVADVATLWREHPWPVVAVAAVALAAGWSR